MTKKINLLFIVNVITVIALIVLPYYLFEGKLSVGGDDTKLFYAYPFLFLKNVSFFAWYNVSSVGINVANQYLLPFLSLWTLLGYILQNNVVLSYIGFSLPLILGFLFFPKFMGELFPFDKKYSLELYIGSLFYILSPILILDQLFIFLTSVWLIGIIPAIGYYYLKYLKTANFVYIYAAMIFMAIFSFTLLAIPWLFGLLISVGICSIVLLLFNKLSDIVIFAKRTFQFFGVIVLSQMFWVLGFIVPYIIKDNNSFAQRFLSESFLDSFRQTIDATATGTIIYPLLNLFHRQIAFDYDWKLKNEFINVFDKTFFLNAIFLVVIAIGLFSYKKYLSKQNRQTYLFIFSAFILTLFFFTVNIGPLKEVFLLMGNIPGFVMFRNFYDKFALGYALLYAIFFTVSLILVRLKYVSVPRFFYVLVLAIIFLNFSTVKSTVNSALWTTENVYKTMTFPSEYLNFMKTVENKVPNSNMILSLPFGSTVYTVVKDEQSDNVYLGTSPVKIFSGVNDISGHLSFNFTDEAGKIDKMIVDRNYEDFKNVLYKHNINYVILTKNIPPQVLNSYAFYQDTIASQDAEFFHAIVDKKIAISEKGNYELYTTERKNSMLVSKNLTFKKRNAVTYELYIRNISKPQKLQFNDSYHALWNLYLEKFPNDIFCTRVISIVAETKECQPEFSYFTSRELQYLWEKSIYSESHTSIDGSDNIWTIDPEYIKKNYDTNYYTTNQDGSINIKMIMYFKPQLYLYYGGIVSFMTILLSTMYLLFTLIRKYEKK